MISGIKPLTDDELAELEGLTTKVLEWVEDVEPDGDEDVGQTGWYRTGAFFLPAPTPEYPDTVDYINASKVADFVLASRAAIPRLIAELRALRAQRAAADEWRPIDTAPLDGTHVILFARSVNATASGVVTGSFIDGQWFETSFMPNWPLGLVPSHWMPRPAFPDERSR